MMERNDPDDKKEEKNNEEEDGVKLENDSNSDYKKQYRYRLYDDARQKSPFGKTLAFFQKWSYLLAFIMLVISMIYIGIQYIKVTRYIFFYIFNV